MRVPCALFFRPFLTILVFASSACEARLPGRIPLYERMEMAGALPTFRIGAGYPEMIFGQVGLALTRVHIPSPLPSVFGMVPYAALQTGLAGFEGILGQTDILTPGGHSPSYFMTYAIAYHQEWRNPQAWNAGPVFQIGFINLGLQASIRYGHEWEGEAAMLVQLFPPLD